MSDDISAHEIARLWDLVAVFSEAANVAQKRQMWLERALSKYNVPEGWISQPVSDWNKVLVDRDHDIAIISSILKEAVGILRVADRYNARHADFTPCDEIRYFNSVRDFLAAVEAP